MLWGFAGKFLPARTRDKVILLDENNWRDEISSHVDKSQLQRHMGGEDEWTFEDAWRNRFRR